MTSTEHNDNHPVMTGPTFTEDGDAGYPNEAWVKATAPREIRDGFTHIDAATFEWAFGNRGRTYLWRQALLDAYEEAAPITEEVTSAHVLAGEDSAEGFNVTLKPEPVSGTVTGRVERI